ncbi:hypothetical protein [Roseobacter sp.]|uniref:hypothetical protein n=1 Tax=Roseobacter sp. TaxID=1907202 RepID=UPI00385E9C99
MTDRAMSEEAMLTSLRDIHLPAEAAGGFIADVAVAVGMASLLALALAGILRALSLQRKSAAKVTLSDRIAALAQLPEREKRVALLHLLRARAPERYSALRGPIYQPGGGIDVATLEAEVNRLV